MLPCEKRLQRLPSGKCCPECVRLHGSNKVTAKLASKMCIFGNRVYRPGRPTRPVDSCTKCQCDGALQVACERTNCPVLDCPKKRQARKRKGDCCKVCVAEEAAEVGGGGGGAGKALAAHRPSHCVHGGQTHADGSDWDDGAACSSCTCQRGETKVHFCSFLWVRTRVGLTIE